MHPPPRGLARYRDLCIDSSDADKMTQFWMEMLDSVRINPVPEPKSFSHQVRLQVASPTIVEATRRGAVVLGGVDPSSVLLADPDGGEFILRRDPSTPQPRIEKVVFGAADPLALADWWSILLGGTSRQVGYGRSRVTNVPGAPFDQLAFTRQRTPKRIKNRIHIDVTTDDVAELVGAGATLRRSPDAIIDWYVLTDPEGNEFCAFTTPTSDPDQLS